MDIVKPLYEIFFLHAILVELRKDNIRNELRSLLKYSILSDEGILKNLMLAISDEQEHFENFNKKRVDINPPEPCDPVTSAIPPKNKSENPIIAEIRSLKATLDSISTWKENFEKREQSRLKKPDTLPCRCPSCHQNSYSRCAYCVYNGSPEHLYAGFLKQKKGTNNKKN